MKKKIKMTKKTVRTNYILCIGIYCLFVSVIPTQVEANILKGVGPFAGSYTYTTDENGSKSVNNDYFSGGEITLAKKLGGGIINSFIYYWGTMGLTNYETNAKYYIIPHFECGIVIYMVNLGIGFSRNIFGYETEHESQNYILGSVIIPIKKNIGIFNLLYIEPYSKIYVWHNNQNISDYYELGVKLNKGV